MTFCRGCGHQIHETAVSCPQCGAVQRTPATVREGSLWLPVSGLVCGLIPALALFDSQSWDRDQLAGAVLFAFAALVLGGVGLAHQPHGQGLAIAALVLGALGLLGAIGTQV